MAKLKILDIDDNVLIECFTSELPLKYEKVVQKSIEMFEDSNPCPMHRSYAEKKLYLEIDNYSVSLLKDGKSEILWEDADRDIKDMLDIENNPHKIIIE